jgi:hypothetical protein
MVADLVCNHKTGDLGLLYLWSDMPQDSPFADRHPLRVLPIAYPIE